jgi:hypothetical protein
MSQYEGFRPVTPTNAAVEAGERVRAGCGRQTLGSHSDPPRTATRGAHELAVETNPSASLWPVWWHVFKDTSAELEPRCRGAAQRLIRHIEDGWRHIEQLQLVCERQRARGDALVDRSPPLVGFVQCHVIVAFTACARGTTTMFSSAAAVSADVADGVARDAENFQRAVAVVALATESPAIPDDFRSVALPEANWLVQWASDYTTLISAAIAYRHSIATP